MNRRTCRQVLECGDGVREVTALAVAALKIAKRALTQSGDSEDSVAAVQDARAPPRFALGSWSGCAVEQSCRLPMNPQGRARLRRALIFRVRLPKKRSGLDGVSPYLGKLVHSPDACAKAKALHEPEGRVPIPCASSLWWGEATDEPAREDVRPTNRFPASIGLVSLPRRLFLESEFRKPDNCFW